MRYALSFALAILVLTAGALTTFRELSVRGSEPDPLPRVTRAGITHVVSPLVPSAADLARFAEADRAWREQHARPFSVAELRARGDGKRSARDLMQDRVYELSRSGRRGDAIRELERWTRAHPRDRQALLWLARMLSEAGRKQESIARYRQVLALGGGRS